MSAENNLDIKLYESTSIENIWDMFHVSRDCLRHI